MVDHIDIESITTSNLKTQIAHAIINDLKVVDKRSQRLVATLVLMCDFTHPDSVQSLKKAIVEHLKIEMFAK